MDVSLLEKCDNCEYINCICKERCNNNEDKDDNNTESSENGGHVNGEINGENSSEGEPQDASEIYFSCTANIYEGKCRLLQFQNAVERYKGISNVSFVFILLTRLPQKFF